MPTSSIIIIAGGGGNRAADSGVVYTLELGEGLHNPGAVASEFEQRSSSAEPWAKTAIGPGETVSFIAAVDVRLP